MAHNRPEPLAKHHRLDEFHCGEAALDEWLKRHARTAHGSDSARVFVSKLEDRETVVGYYALAAAQIAPEDATERALKGQPRTRPVPAILLARLAVDKQHQRVGPRPLAPPGCPPAVPGGRRGDRRPCPTRTCQARRGADLVPPVRLRGVPDRSTSPRDAAQGRTSVPAASRYQPGAQGPRVVDLAVERTTSGGVQTVTENARALKFEQHGFKAS